MAVPLSYAREAGFKWDTVNCSRRVVVTSPFALKVSMRV